MNPLLHTHVYHTGDISKCGMTHTQCVVVREWFVSKYMSEVRSIVFISILFNIGVN